MKNRMKSEELNNMKTIKLNDQEQYELIDLLREAKEQTWSRTYKAIIQGILVKLEIEQ